MAELNSCDWLNDLFKFNLLAPKQSPTPYARIVYFVTFIIGWSTRLRENIATSTLSNSRLATRHCCDQSPPRLTTPQIAQSLRLVAANAIPAGNHWVHQKTANTTTTTTTGFNFYGSLYDEFICEPGGCALIGFCAAFLLFSHCLTASSFSCFHFNVSLVICELEARKLNTATRIGISLWTCSLRLPTDAPASGTNCTVLYLPYVSCNSRLLNDYYFFTLQPFSSQHAVLILVRLNKSHNFLKNCIIMSIFGLTSNNIIWNLHSFVNF